MVTRLVLGCGTLGHAVIDSLTALDGDLRVLSADPDRVETLRNEGIAAEESDPADSEILAGTPADVVFVAGDDPGRNLAAARAAREAHPDALLLAYVGEDATRDQRESFRAVADRVVDPAAALVDHLDTTITSESRQRTRELLATLRGIDGTLGVFMHDNPDPDAIAAAIALVRIAESVGVDAEACYFGEISHQENRAFVNLLDLDVRRLEPEEDVSGFAGFALVDHSRPGVNDQLPPDTEVDLVIDHHPPKEPVDATFVDLRSDTGATSTLLVDHVRATAIDVDESVATALLYGIRVDTHDFTREISGADFEAAAFLLPYADHDVLARVESPSMSADTIETIARAIGNREVEGTVLSSCVGAIADRDALAQAADRLLTMDGITATLVFGFSDGTVYLSARSRGSDVDLGEALREAFGEMGSAGGHGDMAGAQIPLGLFGEMEGEAEGALTDMVENVISTRFFEVMRTGPQIVGPPTGDEEGEAEASADAEDADAADGVGTEGEDGEDGEVGEDGEDGESQEDGTADESRDEESDEEDGDRDDHEDSDDSEDRENSDEHDEE